MLVMRNALFYFWTAKQILKRRTIIVALIMEATWVHFCTSIVNLLVCRVILAICANKGAYRTAHWPKLLFKWVNNLSPRYLNISI